MTTLHKELADILAQAPLETSVLGPFVDLSLALGRPDDALLALDRFTLLDPDPVRAERVGAQVTALRRKVARRGPRPLPAGRPLNVLMASLSGNTSIAAFYERAFGRRHHLVTFGPWRGPDYWQKYAEAFRGHAFYQEGAAEAWVDACARDVRPCDIPVKPGIVDMREVLDRLPRGFVPDLFVWVDQDRFNLPLNLHLLPCPTVALVGDSHLDLAWRVRYATHFDHVAMMFNRHHDERFRQAGCRSLLWLPAACDPEIHAPEVPAAMVHDVTFVGSTHPELHGLRVQLLRRLEGHGFNVHVDCRPPQAAARIFAASRIVLNMSIGDDLNMRVFEGLASGSLLVTNRLPDRAGLNDLFVDGRDLVTFGDEAELVSRLRYYLDPAHEAERAAIAARGRARVLGAHTYDTRVQALVEWVAGAYPPAHAVTLPLAEAA